MVFPTWGLGMNELRNLVATYMSERLGISKSYARSRYIDW